MEMTNPTSQLELLAASASEIHAANERSKLSSKLRVEFKSDEDRTRKRQLRLLKNRQSAALSRQRKKEYINDLELRTNGLISENHDLLQKITKLTSMNLEHKLHIDNLEKRLTEAKNENNDLRSRLSVETATTNKPLPPISPSFNDATNTNEDERTAQPHNTSTTTSAFSTQSQPVNT